MNRIINITIVYALPDIQYLKKLKLKKNITVKKAIILSKFLTLFKNINLTKNKVGIFGKEISLCHKVNNGDRIEIYRLLTFHAKDLRKKRMKYNKL